MRHAPTQVRFQFGWKSLIAEAMGELPLTAEQVQKIERAIQQPLPRDLDLFIGVRE
ncbi:pyocin S6 family toxin immunity protein [Pseudomonas sp. B21-028]|uniref:pyocin S6 family toxin immunity protein n=1 Tax=Pseudomonas sp. B21-028 TaxID=2895480 RepID=UPI00216068EC|nr:pyocin S6 family toxin immunity protein [Pseudomonas sp. B21-028]